MRIFSSNSLHTILTRDDKIRYLFQTALVSGRSSTEKEGQNIQKVATLLICMKKYL